MIIGIDASRACRARRTGTERYSLEIIRHLLALPDATAHQWRLYTDAPVDAQLFTLPHACLLYTSPSPPDRTRSRMPSSAWKKKKHIHTQYNAHK